jgi:hypothetical protein
MGLFNLIKDVVVLPVSVVADIVDFISGSDEEESHTIANVKEVIEDIKDTL